MKQEQFILKIYTYNQNIHENTKVLNVPVLSEEQWENVNHEIMQTMAQNLSWEQFNYVASANKEQKEHLAQVMIKLWQESDLKLEGDRLGRECHGIIRKGDKEKGPDKDDPSGSPDISEPM